MRKVEHMIEYNHFACPNCLRLTTKPWSQAWCACDYHAPVLAYDANDPGIGIVWTRMVQIRNLLALRALILQETVND